MISQKLMRLYEGVSTTELYYAYVLQCVGPTVVNWSGRLS